MSVAVLPSPAKGKRATRLWTIADVAALPSELPTGPARYELDNGRILIMPPAADDHGSVELKMGHYLLVQGEMRGLGKAECGDVGIILWRNPDRLVGADDVFIASGSLPVRRSLEGYLETIPDLVAEIRSKNDTLPECLEKIRDYHKAGVKVVWLIDPRARSVTAYRPGAPPQVFGENDILTVEDIIPGFHVVVRELFK